MKLPILLLAMLAPVISFGKIGLGINAGVIPNYYSASAKTPNVSNSNMGGAFSAKIVFGNHVQTGAVVEIGSMGTVPSPYFAAGLLGNLSGGIGKVDIYGGGTIRYLSAGGNENRSRGLDYGLQAGTNIKLVSKLHLNLEAGVRYARLVETATVLSLGTSPIDFKQRIVSFPLLIGVRFEL